MAADNKEQKSQVLTSPWMIFLVTALGVGMSSLDSGIVNVALPTLSSQYHVAISIVQWVVSSYLLMICVTLPLFGYLSDLLTKRRIYLLGLFIFTLGSALCGFAFSFISLVIFRLLQGTGAAMIFCNNQAILMTSFSPRKQARALGINAMLYAIGSVAGPGIGGFLIGLGDWRFIFFINIPLGVLACILGYKLLPQDKKQKIQQIDFKGIIYFSIMMTTFILMLSDGANGGLFSCKLLSMLIVTIIAGIFFFREEKRSLQPMISLCLFSERMYLLGNIVSFLVYLTLAGNFILLPFYLEKQFLLSPDMIGLVLLIAPICIVMSAPISGFFTGKINSEFLVTLGMSMIFCGILFLSLSTLQTSLWSIIVDQVLIGVGCGLFTSPNSYTMLNNVPHHKISIATSINSLVRGISKIVGTVLATFIFTLVQGFFQSSKQAISVAFIMGFRSALMIAAGLLLIGIFIYVKR